MDTTAKPVLLQELSPQSPSGNALFDGRHELIKDVKVRLSVVIGRAELTVEQLFDLKHSSVIALDALADEPVEVVLNGRTIARGELVVVGETFGVRLTEVPER